MAKYRFKSELERRLIRMWLHSVNCQPKCRRETNERCRNQAAAEYGALYERVG